MGLFSKKKKVSVDDMSMQMMLAAGDTIGKIQAFNDIDDVKSMMVSMGYFYGFLKFHLNSITNSGTTNTVIEKSIANLEKATQNTPAFKDFGDTVRKIAKESAENTQYAMKELKDNPFMGLAVFYLKDLYDSTTLDVSKVDIAENNMRFLYETVSGLTKDIKIV